MHRFSTFRAFDGDVIDVRTMEFYGFCTLVTAHLIQFFSASHRMLASALTFPDIQRSSPVTVSGNTPVLHILQPVAETTFTDAFRDPVDGIVVTDQIIFYRCHLDKPGFSCIIDQWCITTPAVWIFMLEFRSFEEFSFFVQIHQNFRIGIFYKDICIRSFFGQMTFSIYKLYERQIIVASDTAVIFTESRCDMNDTGTIAHGYVSITGNKMCFLFLFCCCFACACIQRFVFFVFQIFSCIFLKNFVSRFLFVSQFAKHFVQQGFCHVIGVSVSCLYFTVSLIRVHTQCHVGRQCPRSCGPCQEISIFADHFKANDRGAFFYGFVSLRYFLCRKRCSTTRTVRYDLESFI